MGVRESAAEKDEINDGKDKIRLLSFFGIQQINKIDKY